MSSWRLAKSLECLRDQINVAHPKRSKVSDGSIGDARHSARGSASDHNPNERGIVCAIDITHDPANRVDGHILSRELITDPRQKYVIFAGEIFKARTGVWEPYHGANRHDHHVHISVKSEVCDNIEPWTLVQPPTT